MLICVKLSTVMETCDLGFEEKVHSQAQIVYELEKESLFQILQCISVQKVIILSVTFW